MLDAIHVSTLVAAIASILVFVPLGGAAFFVVYKVARNCSRWTRHYLEINTAFLTILACTLVAPMELVTDIMSFLNVPTPRGLELVETLTMRICQVATIVNVAAIAIKRVHTMTRGASSHSKRAEIGSILLAWVTGLSVGIGTTYQAARAPIDIKQNFTLEFSSGCFANSNAVYFSTVYLGLLLTTTLIILCVCALIIRHIQSSSLVSLHRIRDAASGQKDKVSENITATDKNATMISGPINDQGCSGVIANNWVSNQPSLCASIRRAGIIDPRLPSIAAVVEESGGVEEFHLHGTPSPEPSTSNCGTKNPLSIRNKASDTIEEGESKIDVLSILPGEQIRKTHNAKVLRSNSAQRINSGNLRYSSLSSISLPYGCSNPLDDSNDSIRCSIQSGRFNEVQNQSPKPAKLSAASSSTWTSKGNSTSNLPTLTNTRNSTSSTPLCRSNILSSNSSNKCETPSPMKRWLSVDRVLSSCIMDPNAEAGGSGILSSSVTANGHQGVMSVTLNACADGSDHADKSNSSPQVSPKRALVPQLNKSRYTQKLIRRLLLAFGVNILTQIPLVSLQLANVSCQTFRIVRPVLQSIALVSFALCPYVYILHNKVIHKLLIRSQRTGDGCRK